MTFDALNHKLQDLVVIAPTAFSKDTYQHIMQSNPSQSHTFDFVSLQEQECLVGRTLLTWLQDNAKLVVQDDAAVADRADDSHHSASTPDWAGEVLSTGLDGLLTVRVSTGDTCRDIILEYDQVIHVVDEDYDPSIGNGMSERSDMDTDLYDVAYGSPISETVEYDGGQRIDDDSGDENWEDEEVDPEEDSKMVDELEQDTSDDVDVDTSGGSEVDEDEHEALAITTAEPIALEHHEPAHQEGAVGSSLHDVSNLPSPAAKTLYHFMPAKRPPAFLVLDRDPPEDSHLLSASAQPTSASFLRRIMKEHKMLNSALPLGRIYVRTYENRLDILRCLIIGPEDTPYEHAPFLVDLYLNSSFPIEPPKAHFHSWTSGLGRVNPNLYEDGKICLSLLGTWQGHHKSEQWSANSTILQLLLSLQALVLVKEPFYNEAGFHEYQEDRAYTAESHRYSEKAFLISRRFITHVLTQPVPGLEDVLAWQYLSHEDSAGLLATARSRGVVLISNSEKAQQEEEDGSGGLVDGKGSRDDATKVFLPPLSRGAIVMLTRTIAEWAKFIESRSRQPRGSDTAMEE